MAKTPAKKTSVAKKPTATKKSAPAKKPTAEKTVAKKPAAKKVGAKSRNIGAEERYKMIEVAAYYIAERNHFKGSATDFWVAAEAEISKAIGK